MSRHPTQPNPFALWSKAIGCKGVFALALPTTKLYRDSAGTIREAVETDSVSGVGGSAGVPSTGDLDTEGSMVPTWMRHTFTYDLSQNVETDTVHGADGQTWVRTYEWTAGALASDSGWIKQ